MATNVGIDIILKDHTRYWCVTNEDCVLQKHSDLDKAKMAVQTWPQGRYVVDTMQRIKINC